LRPSRSTAGYYLSARLAFSLPVSVPRSNSNNLQYQGCLLTLRSANGGIGGSMESSRFGLRAVGLLVTAALLAGAGTASAAGLALPAPWVPCVKRSGAIQLGATEAGRVNLDARLQDITLHSQAMHAD